MNRPKVEQNIIKKAEVAVERKIFTVGIEHGANQNVYSRCSGPEMVLDHHQPNVHDNLWTEINAVPENSAFRE